MIYYELCTENLLEAFFYLEELICFSTIINTKCFLKISSNVTQFLDISPFEIIDEIPQNLPSFTIQDCPHIFNKEMIEIATLEFIGSKLTKFNGLSRLDKYVNLDFVVEFKSPNFYENKYFSLKDSYKSAITEASQISFNPFYLKKCEYYKNILKPLPLVIFPADFKQANYNLPFEKCYYISEGDIDANLFAQNDIEATNVYSLIDAYPIDFDIDILLFYLSDYFQEIYGFAYDLRFALMCKNKYKQNKNWQVKLLDCDFSILNNNEMKTIFPSKPFTFAQKDLNIQRNKICKCLRFSECIP